MLAAASPLMPPFGGSSCSWIQRIHEPSGARRLVHDHRLADHDRRLRREQAALRLVDGPRHAVQARRDVDDRRAAPAARRPPSAAARRARSGSASRRGRSGSGVRPRVSSSGTVASASRSPVELGRRDVADHRPLGAHLLAGGEPDAVRAARADEHALDVGAGARLAARVLDDADERLHEPRAAAAGHRHPAELERDAITCVMNPDIAWSGPRPGVQHPGREQPVDALGARTSPRASRGSS